MNRSNKEKMRDKREHIKKHLGIDPDTILCGKFSPNSCDGKQPKEGKSGKATNQKGAFGKPAWMRDLLPSVYQTYDLTNKERIDKTRQMPEKTPSGLLAKTLGE